MTDPQKQELAKDREIEAKATPGPWYSSANDPSQLLGNWGNWSVDSDASEKELNLDIRRRNFLNGLPHETISDNVYAKDDADFISHARNRFPALLDLIDEQEKRIEDVTDVLEKWQSGKIVIAHRCTDKFRGYPSVVCSCCRDAGAEDNFSAADAVALLNKQEKEIERLKNSG